jgi:hypothetical protein
LSSATLSSSPYASPCLTIWYLEIGDSIPEDTATNDEVLTLQSMFQKVLQERQKTDGLIAQAGVSFESMVKSEVSIRYLHI